MPLSIEKLRTLIPLSKLNREALSQVAESGKLLELDQGTTVFAAGSEDEFIYYLLSGRISMSDREGMTALISADTDPARFAFGSLKPRPSNARVDSAKASLLRLNGKELGTLIAWHEQVSEQEDSGLSFAEISSSLLVSELELADDDSSYDNWMMALLRCRAFYKVPPENVQLLAEKMEPVSYKAGDVVVRQNEPGYYYYVIRDGRCRVQINEVEVGTLGPMDAFGEGALLCDAPRSATVEMLSGGLLMRLSREHFNELLIPPLVKRVSVAKAMSLAKQGAILIDVRSRLEFQQQRLQRSINIPLFVLRIRLRRLTPRKTYIIYCDTGTRSSAATFLLNQAGYDAYLLDDPQAAFKVMVAKG